jgi:hypothetical protein
MRNVIEQPSVLERFNTHSFLMVVEAIRPGQDEGAMTEAGERRESGPSLSETLSCCGEASQGRRR